MPETIGLILLSAVGVGEITGIAGLGTIAGTTIAGVSIATVVGSAAIIGVSVGLQYALAPPRPGVPTPESGSQAVKQSVPPRSRGYGVNRLAGFFMLFEAVDGPPATSFDVLAFHSGRIDQVTTIYLHDDPVQIDPPINRGGYGVVLGTYPDGRYGATHIYIEVKLGTVPQTSSDLIAGSGASINSIWAHTFQGNGIAYLVLRCAGAQNVPEYTQTYPHQLPTASVVAYCSPVWDPRDPAQARGNPSTWQISFNPVIQLIDYLTRADGGMGLDYERMIAPNLAQWIGEANLCDELVDAVSGTEPRYASNGWFHFDNSPEEVIGAILSTCDGWLAETGDGTLSITVGLYRAPGDALTEKHIFGFALNYGQADEQMVNQLEITFTDPASKYVSVQTEPWRDEEAIATTGVVRSQALDLKWVQSNSQARRLASRAMQRLNPLMTGSFTTSLYGLRYLGQRWVGLKYPFVSGLQDCVVEIQNADVDLLAARIVWDFIRIEPDDIEAYYPPDDEGSTPIVPPPTPATALPLKREDASDYIREDGAVYLRESA